MSININSYQVSIKPSSDCLQATSNDNNQATHHKLNDDVVWVISTTQQDEPKVDLMIRNLNEDESYVVSVQTLNESATCGNIKTLDIRTG